MAHIITHLIHCDPPKATAMLESMMAQYHTRTKVAEALGVTIPTVTRWCERLGIKSDWVRFNTLYHDNHLGTEEHNDNEYFGLPNDE